MNNNSQAVRIPQEFRLVSSRGEIFRNAEGDLVLHPIPTDRGADLLDPGVIERVLRNEATVCGKSKPQAFEKMRALLMPLITCRTCLDYYGLQDSVVVGEIGNMLRVFEAQASASKVITL